MMVLNENPRYWFYPDVKGNLELEEKEQIAVEIIRPTGFQSSDFKKTETRTEYYPDDQPFDENGNYKAPKKLRSLTIDVKFNSELILRTCVGEIKNLSVQGEDGKIREIRNGKENGHGIRIRAKGAGAAPQDDAGGAKPPEPDRNHRGGEL